MSLRAIADILDHIKPRSRGGSNAVSNLRISCRFCNMAKAARLPAKLLEWASRIVAAAGEI
jgi:5-methylcytosine-specific restriction endonuclease McrA